MSEPMQENQPWTVRMMPRSPDEPFRSATMLELFFDLAFVVAVAQAASSLHHAVAEGEGFAVLPGYGLVFFAVWWAWMNFTWFASAFDTDDVPYRLAVFVQITGALVIAAGVPQAFDTGELGLVVVGYVIMRIAGVALWLRAAYATSPPHAGAIRYAIGVSVLQVAWVLVAFAVPTEGRNLVVLFLIVCEMAVPAWAERVAKTPWHPEHIAERYSLFTIIVLGESILAASLGFQSAVDGGGVDAEVLGIAVGALLIVFSMWWLYFEQSPHEGEFTGLKAALFWGYGHLPLWAGIAATGAGIAVGIDVATDHAEISALAAGMAVAIPVVVYLVTLWALHAHGSQSGLAEYTLRDNVIFLGGAVVVLLTPLTPLPVLLIGLVCAALVVVKLRRVRGPVRPDVGDTGAS